MRDSLMTLIAVGALVFVLALSYGACLALGLA